MPTLSVRIIFFLLSFFYCLPTFSQLGTITFDIQKDKPEKFKSKTLKSETTGDKKFTRTKKLMQNTFTHYNYYFNANNRVNQVLERARMANKDDYTKLLPFYGYTFSATTAQKSELDSAIYKATAGILLHDLRNDWVDNLYLIIGKAYFFKQEFDSASTTFQFINYNLFPRKKKNDTQLIVGTNSNAGGNTISIASKETPTLLNKAFTVPPSRNDALIWQIRTLIEMQEYSESAGLINTLQHDQNFPARLKPELEEMNAYWFYKQKMYDSSATHLAKALAAAEDKDDKARWEFLLAQMYENTGQPAKASNYYSKAIKHTTDPLMDIYANLNNAKMYTTDGGKSFDNSINNLLKMAKRDKYSSYRDIVYYSAGELALEKKDTVTAEAFFKRSLLNNVLNAEYKNRAYLQLADIAFYKKNYKLAYAMYDSLNLTDNVLVERAAEISDLKKALSKIVERKNIIEREDSLQHIALLHESERMAYVQQVLKNIRKQNGLKDEAINNLSSSNIFNTNRNESADIFSQNDTKGEWYFYNPSVKAKGYSEFVSRWGQRSNTDNWRRKAAVQINITSLSAINDNNIAIVKNNASQTGNFNNSFSYDAMISNLPTTPEKLIASNDLIAAALFELGKLYQNSLENYPMAIDTYETSLQRFPARLYAGELYFNLLYCYQKTGNTAKATYYKNLLSSQFNNSKYAQLILNPNTAKQGAIDPVITKKYENIYTLYIEGNFEKAEKEKKIADSMYSNNYWSPQLLYIESVYYIKQRKDSIALNTLQNILTLYPNSILKDKATTMISVLTRRKEIEDYLTNLNISRSKEDSLIAINDKFSAQNKPLSEVKKPVTKGADTSRVVIVQPKIVTPQPIVSGSFSFIETVPHNVLMILNKVDPVYVSEARNAFIRYNREKFSSQNIEIKKDAIDIDRNILIFSQFATAGEALIYADKLKRSAASEVSWLPAAKYSFIIISDANLQVLKTNKDLQGYIKLLNTKYPGNF